MSSAVGSANNGDVEAISAATPNNIKQTSLCFHHCIHFLPDFNSREVDSFIGNTRCCSPRVTTEGDAKTPMLRFFPEYAAIRSHSKPPFIVGSTR